MANPPTPDAWAPSKFPKSLRGYSPSPVDDAIAAAVKRIEELTVENRQLSKRVQDLEDRLSVHDERALAAQEALITAQTERRKTLEAAEAEAEELRANARDEGDRIVHEASEHAGELTQQAERKHEEVMKELEDLRRAAETEARAEADRIRGEAKADAARRLEKADREIATVAAQLERLEKRRSEFLDYLSKELGVASPALQRKRSRRKSQPLDIRFRRSGEGPPHPPAEVQFDG